VPQKFKVAPPDNIESPFDIGSIVRSRGFVGPGAEVADWTARAVGALGLADSPAVEDQEVGDEGPLVPGNDLAKLLLDLVLLVALGQA